MEIINQTKITKATEQQRQEIISLLQTDKLPVKDLPASLDNFIVALQENKVLGAIGLEQYGDCGLLRSMVVSKDFRNKSIASQLVQELERHATISGIDCMYLLTETASQYFQRKGYNRISREEVSESIRGSSEFSRVCPVSAIVMKKTLRKNE